MTAAGAQAADLDELMPLLREPIDLGRRLVKCLLKKSGRTRRHPQPFQCE